MKKIGICTLYTGFNYGSALQVAATKRFLHSLGYQGEILKLSGSMIAGRDVRVKKLLVLGINLLRHLPSAKKSIRTYMGSPDQVLLPETKTMFLDFIEHYLCPSVLPERRIKSLAKTDEYMAFLCGSDQIWNSATYYVDPFYYLTFAPEHKRIAFAPSFGRNYIAGYNRRKMKKYISGIPHLSIREEAGSNLISDLVGRPAQVLVDPTLLLNKQEWCDLLALDERTPEQPYVLAYFLDEPSEKAKKALKFYRDTGYKIFTLPYQRSGDWFDEVLSAGPREFLEYLLNAAVVCTDSFHGTAFALNFEKPFYTFEREYGAATKQIARFTSLLGKVGMTDRYDAQPQTVETICFDASRRILDAERDKSRTYLLTSLASLEK